MANIRSVLCELCVTHVKTLGRCVCEINTYYGWRAPKIVPPLPASVAPVSEWRRWGSEQEESQCLEIHWVHEFIRRKLSVSANLNGLSPRNIHRPKQCHLAPTTKSRRLCMIIVVVLYNGHELKPNGCLVAPGGWMAVAEGKLINSLARR